MRLGGGSHRLKSLIWLPPPPLRGTSPAGGGGSSAKTYMNSRAGLSSNARTFWISWAAS